METIDCDGSGCKDYQARTERYGNGVCQGLEKGYDPVLVNEREMGRQWHSISNVTDVTTHDRDPPSAKGSFFRLYTRSSTRTTTGRMHIMERGRAMIQSMLLCPTSNVYTAGMFLILLLATVAPVNAVLIPFENCLSESWQNDLPLRLQFVPEFVDATFNTTDSAHSLEVLAYINVNGTFPGTPMPPPPSDIDYWQGNDTDRGGKIVDVLLPDGPNKITTAATAITVLTYEPYSINRAFCQTIENGTCPLAPRFDVNQ